MVCVGRCFLNGMSVFALDSNTGKWSIHFIIQYPVMAMSEFIFSLEPIFFITVSYYFLIVAKFKL